MSNEFLHCIVYDLLVDCKLNKFISVVNNILEAISS